MRVNKYVLDANIWMSYFISERVQILVDIVKEYEITFFICDELITEFKRISQYDRIKNKYEINVKEALETIQELSVHFSLSYPIKSYVPKDADDNYIIALALQTNSGFVTTGDTDILDLKETLEKKFTKLKIITKAEFEKKFPLFVQTLQLCKQ